MVLALIGFLGLAAPPTTFAAPEVEAPVKPAPRAITGGHDLDWSQFPGSAILEGRIENHEVPTRYWFKWWRIRSYVHKAFDNEEIGYDGAEPVIAEELIEGLRPHSTYHYRLVAKNPGGRHTDGSGPSVRRVSHAGLPSSCVGVAEAGTEHQREHREGHRRGADREAEDECAD